jgi:hypothetical protein
MIRRLVCLGVLTLALAFVLVPLYPLITHADAVDDWYAAVCGDNGLIFKRIAYAGMAVAGSSLLANFKTLQKIPVVGPILNFVALNWRELLTAATNVPPAATKILAVCAVAPLMFLAACGTPPASSTGTPATAAQTAAADASKVLYYLQAGGCLAADVANAAAPIAAPIVAAVDPAGNVVLNASLLGINTVTTAENGGTPCSVTVPPAAVAPAAAPATKPAAPAS